MNKRKIITRILVAAWATGGVTLTGKDVYADTKIVSSVNNASSYKNKSAQGLGSQGTIINVSTSLRMRKLPNTSGSIIGYLKNGQTFKILSKEGQWYKINFNNKTGYVHSDYVKAVGGAEDGSSKPIQTVTKGTIVNVSSNLRIRKTPSTGSQTLGYLKNRSKIDIVSKEGSWYKIKFNGTYGYVYGSYVKVDNNSNNSNNASSNNSNNNSSNRLVETEKYGKVNVNSSLRVREKPMLNAKIVASLKSGEVVEILGESSGFYKVKEGGTTGYSSKEFIKEVSKDEWGNNSSNSNNNSNSSNSSSNSNSMGDSIYTNYTTSLNSYIKLQQSRVSSYSYSYYEKYINPNKSSNKFQYLRLDDFRSISVSKLNDYFNKKNAGVLKGHAKGFVDACKEYDIDPIYFAAQSIHETGYGKSRLAKGYTIKEIANINKEIHNSRGELIGYEMIKLSKPVTVYNLFGIGAYDNLSTFKNRSTILGTTYAYNHGWTSVDKAIDGAAKFVSDNYINSKKYNQNTLYKMRYSPNVNLMWHQYATTPWYAENIGTQMSEMKGIYLANSDFLYDNPRFNGAKSVSK